VSKTKLYLRNYFLPHQIVSTCAYATSIDNKFFSGHIINASKLN